MSDWQRVKSIFEEIIELPEPEREPGLERFCSGDAALRAAVSDLLAAHDSAGDFLHAPTMNPAGEARLAALVGAPQVAAPTHIGPYTLLEVIGEGGFGTVYRAEQQAPVRRVVALKVIKPGMDSREVIARFEGERQALAMMNHPHIAAVLDAGATPDRRPYFVMEYVPGMPITRYCDEHTLPVEDRLRLFIQVCQAVQHAHQKGIIHRDIKPSNVLVVPAGDSAHPDAAHSTHSGPAARAKVIDFGVAKATDQRLAEHTVATQQGMFLGTPAYMSPEQAGVGPLDIDTRTDIYSLGVLLYELLTGAPPFDPRSLIGSSHSEIQRIIREVDPPRPSTRLSTLRDEPDVGGETPASPSRIAAQRQTDARSLIRHVRGDLDWIVMKCLEKDRARRYDTANDVALEIERYLNHEPVKAGPPSLTYRLGKFARRNRAAVVAVTGITIALLVGLGISIAGFLAASRARDLADAQRVLAVRNADEALRAARKAETVTQFLQETLAAADPKVSARRDMTVREALNQAVAKLDAGSMSEQPETEAAIRMTIGRAWMGLAQYAEAERQVESSLALYRDLRGDKSFDAAEALQLRGSVRSLAGRLDEAESDFSAALSIQRAGRPAGHAAVAACLNDLATTITSQGRYDEAAALLTEALEISRRSENERESVLPEAVNNLGLVYLLQKNWSAAQPLFEEAVTLNQRLLGRLHPNIATNLDNLAQSFQGQGDLDRAEKHYREAISMRRELFGSDHPDVAASLHNIATLLWIRGDRAGAEKAVRESLDIFRRVQGPAHPDVVRVVHSLVSVVGARGLFDEAESLMAETFQAVRDAPDVTLDDKLSLARRLVELNAFRKNSEKAEEWAKAVRALQATTQPAPPSMPEVAD